MKRKESPLLILLFFCAISALFASDPLENPNFKAMELELKRSISRLKFGDFKSPYFIAYQMMDSSDTSVNIRYGEINQDQVYTGRSAYVELRYGNYEMDSTDRHYRGVSDSVALADDRDALRHALWLLSDQAYKQAVKDYLQKQGKKITDVEMDQAADFSREKAHQGVAQAAPILFSLESYKQILKRVSVGLKEYKELIDQGISFRRNIRKISYLNSEGTKISMPQAGNPFFIYLWAKTQSDDGMNLEQARTFSFKSEQNLPTESDLKNAARSIADSLLKLRLAPLADPYTAPAILDPESTGVLFHEALGHRLEGERQKDEDEGQTFKGQVGKKIIPAFLTVEDDPTLEQWNGLDLNGFYTFDEEGVRAQKVVLVENGVLRNYLFSRRTVDGFNRSNGHGRAQFGRDPIGRMSNLLVKSSLKFSAVELKKMLLQECKRQGKPYGLWIRKMQSGDTFTSRGRYQAFRGTPQEVVLVDAETGEEKLVRGVEVVGTPLITINKIIAVGDSYEVNNAFCGAESGLIPVATVAPAALVEEVELQRLKDDKQRPPILPNPIFDKDER